MKKKTNIFLCGMGGQGIAFLSRILMESCLDAGYTVKGCDTHGMAQRGGTVVAHMRIGDGIFSPLVPEGEADLLIGLERLETLRGMSRMLRPGGRGIYYDAAYPPASVRTGKSEYVSEEDLNRYAVENGITLEKVFHPRLPDPRLQNTALIGRIISSRIIPGIEEQVVLKVMDKLLPEAIKDINIRTLKECAGKHQEVSGEDQ